MPTLLSIQALEADRLIVQRLLRDAPEDPWGTARLMWENRLREIDEQVAALTATPPQLASVAVFFDGAPVVGSSDIQLDFATTALDKYQAVVSAAYAARIVDTVSQRGVLPGANRSQLFINDVVRGSFGFVLEEAATAQRELIPTLLSEAIDESTGLLESLSQIDDDTFETTLGEVPQRLIAAVKDLANVLFQAQASARIVGDARQATLSLEDVSRLANRLSDVTVQTIDEIFDGMLEGVLPGQKRFEFKSFSGESITGTASEDLVQEYLADDRFRIRKIRQPVRANFKRTQTIRNGRQVREQFSLESVDVLGESIAATN